MRFPVYPGKPVTHRLLDSLVYKLGMYIYDLECPVDNCLGNRANKCVSKRAIKAEHKHKRVPKPVNFVGFFTKNLPPINGEFNNRRRQTSSDFVISKIYNRAAETKQPNKYEKPRINS